MMRIMYRSHLVLLLAIVLMLGAALTVSTEDKTMDWPAFYANQLAGEINEHFPDEKPYRATIEVMRAPHQDSHGALYMKYLPIEESCGLSKPQLDALFVKTYGEDRGKLIRNDIPLPELELTKTGKDRLSWERNKEEILMGLGLHFVDVDRKRTLVSSTVWDQMSSKFHEIIGGPLLNHKMAKGSETNVFENIDWDQSPMMDRICGSGRSLQIVIYMLAVHIGDWRSSASQIEATNRLEKVFNDFSAHGMNPAMCKENDALCLNFSVSIPMDVYEMANDQGKANLVSDAAEAIVERIHTEFHLYNGTKHNASTDIQHGI